MAGWLYDRRLLYPERAEALGDDFADYRVTLEHWSALSKAFRDAYQPVWVRKMSRVLIVCGDQGSGKSLFCRRLAMDYESTRKALQASRTCAPDLANNLWHLLVVDPHDRAPPGEAIEVTTHDTVIRTVQEHAGWLDELRQWGLNDKSRVRVVVFDNFHRERFLADLAGVPIDVYVQRREAGQESGLLPLVAQSLVALARGDLLRSVFVCLANDRPLMEQLVRAIEREHRELPQLHATPQPPAPIKEKIVRSNLNRLNNISYWYSLDRAAPDARVQVRDAITGGDGVGRVYELVEQGVALPRSGAPTTPNRLTLVTLGSSPGAVSAKIKASWERLPPKVLHSGQSLGEWVFTRGFARALPARDPDTRRRGELFDSEFNVRWIALGMGATRALVGTPGAPGDLGGMLLDAILSPWTADGSTLAPLEDSASLEAPDDAWESSFRSKGQVRAVEYEAALRARIAGRALGYSTAMPGYSAVRPDVTVAPYEACALSSAPNRDEDSLRDAMRRRCHVIEFTSFLRDDLEGIDAYLLEKVTRYATMLEDL